MGLAVRILGGVAAVFVLASIGFVAWAWEPSLDPISDQQIPSFDADTIAHGAMLVATGGCVSCHTAEGGETLAGGFPVPTPFGTIYGTNITPDPETGIGRWSEAAFMRAMHSGIRRDGAYLYPPFPIRISHASRITT